MKPLYTSEEMRELDRFAIEALKVPADHLMNNAGLRIFDRLAALFPERPPVLILAGPGNNGGDGIALATYLQRAAWEVKVVVITSKQEYGHPASVFMEIAAAFGVEIEKGSAAKLSTAKLTKLLENCEILVDALFGIGLDKPLSPEYSAIINTINECSEVLGFPVVSIDCPSGLCTTTGRAMGAVVRANATLTLGFEKLGLHNYLTADNVGKLEILDIGFPADVAVPFRAACLDEYDMPIFLAPRKIASHKGTYGCVLVVGGSRGMTGAPRLAARAALRAGCGMVRLVVPDSVRPECAGAELEAMVEGAEDGGTGHFTAAALPKIIELSKWADVIAVGCGVGRSPETIALVREVLAKVERPVVLDADGILALKDKEGFFVPKVAVGITPHPGEFASLTGKAAGDATLGDPFAAVREFVQATGIPAAYKCGRSFTVEIDGSVVVVPTGNPGMATAGSGDVLTGIISGMLAHYAAFAGPAKKDFPYLRETKKAIGNAMSVGQYVHGLAGDLAAEEIGIDGTIAGDILERIPAALDLIRAGAVREFYKTRDAGGSR